MRPYIEQSRSRPKNVSNAIFTNADADLLLNQKIWQITNFQEPQATAGFAVSMYHCKLVMPPLFVYARYRFLTREAFLR